jgi:probable phosphoglycerate mutase
MRDLYVVTHAQSQHHLDGVVGGWHDSELSALGRVQAARIANAVSALVPADASARVHTSDLRRAVQTAEPIAEALGVQAEQDPRLREISYGSAEGRPQAWLEERFVPAPETAAERLDHRFGLPDAESRRQVGERVYAVVDEMLQDERSHAVVVTHGFTLSLVLAAWQRIPLDHAAWVSFPSTAGGITHLREDDRYRNRSIVSFNRTDHLVSP